MFRFESRRWQRAILDDSPDAAVRLEVKVEGAQVIGPGETANPEANGYIQGILRFEEPIDHGSVLIKLDTVTWRMWTAKAPQNDPKAYKFELGYDSFSNPEVVLVLETVNGLEGKPIIRNPHFFRVAPRVPPESPLGPKPAPTFTVWAVDPTEERPPEVLMSKPEALEMLGASPDGPFWLLMNVQTVESGAMSGELSLYNLETGEMREGPWTDSTLWPARWSGSGFWVRPLVHVDLQLRIQPDPLLATSSVITDVRQIIDGGFSRDGRRAAFLVMREGRMDTRSVDLVILETGGTEPQILPNVVQPWFGKAGAHACLSMSPNGNRLVILSQSPGAALVETALPDQWLPLLGDFTAPRPVFDQTAAPGGCAQWTDDGTLFWLPGRRVMSASGEVRDQLPGESTWAVWSIDGSVLVAAGGQLDRMQIYKTDGQVRTFASPEAARAFAILPDGRILTARTEGVR